VRVNRPGSCARGEWAPPSAPGSLRSSTRYEGLVTAGERGSPAINTVYAGGAAMVPSQVLRQRRTVREGVEASTFARESGSHTAMSLRM